MCYIQHVFIAVLCLSLGKTSQDCDHGQYYDPITFMCHPCSDCSDGRPGNIYCERGCKGRVSCGDSRYYDPHTGRCHPCAECLPPWQDHKFCRDQCKALTTPTPATTTLVTDVLLAADPTMKILTIVFPVLLGIIVLILIALGIYSAMRRCQRRAGNDGSVMYDPTTPQHETEYGNPTSIMLPSARPMFQSLPLTVNADGHSNHGRVPNSFSEAQLQNEETVPLRQAISPDRSTSIHLVEESDGEGPRGILRRNSSSRLHSSMSGNPVCHPEQEDYATMAPTLVMAAAEPHMSFDPDKPCCDAAVGEHSLTPANSHNSVSETLCKSNR